MRIAKAASAVVACLLATTPVTAQITPQMSDGIAGARFVPIYSNRQRALAVQTIMKLSAPPTLGEPVSLTPNAPYAGNGAHLSFWKPSFVLGTPNGGEAGVNFWGIHGEGHINIGFAAETVGSHVLDCRLLTPGSITYKVYAGASAQPREQSEQQLNDGHLLLVITPGTEPISVELWPTPVAEVMGFFGCELAAIE